MPPILTCPGADAWAPCFDATNNLSGKYRCGRHGSTYQGKSGSSPHRALPPHEYITGTPSPPAAGHCPLAQHGMVWYGHCPLAQQLLLVFRHGNSRHDIDWAVSLHKSLIAHFSWFFSFLFLTERLEDEKILSSIRGETENINCDQFGAHLLFWLLPLKFALDKMHWVATETTVKLIGFLLVWRLIAKCDCRIVRQCNDL